ASPPVAAPPQTDPAERAWLATQNTTSIAVLEDFVRQFGATPYGSMARARLEELKNQKAAAVGPAPPAPSAIPTREIGYSDWLSSGDYQKLFNQMVAQRQYPRVIEAGAYNNTVMFRAAFAPYPSGSFGFYSHHGLTPQDFEQKDRRYRDLGFTL